MRLPGAVIERQRVVLVRLDPERVERGAGVELRLAELNATAPFVARREATVDAVPFALVHGAVRGELVAPCGRVRAAAA